MSEEVSSKQPQVAAAHAFQSAISLHRQGRLREAEQLYRSFLQANPTHFDCLHNLGLARAQQGEFDDAVGLIGAALKQNPDSVEANTNLGNALVMLNRTEEAVAPYERAITLRPDSAAAYNNLGSALRTLGRYQEAIAHYRRALAINPRFTKAYNNLGNALEGLQRPEEAIPCYQKALAIDPYYAEAHNNLGVVLAAVNRWEEAITHYERAIALKPNYADAHNNFGAALQVLGRFEEALRHCERAVAIKPGLAEAHNNLGNALKALNRYPEALASYQKALAADRGYAQAHSNMGDALRELGRADQARRAYEAAVRLAPAKPEFYRRLADTKRFAADDPHLAVMRKLTDDMGSLSIADRIELHFALAKALADLGQNEQSFHHLLEGNALHRQRIAYDESATLRLFDRIRAVFTPQLMSSKQGLGDPSAIPVFVIGMIRSGTTLVEQILAGHPKVHAAGELTDFAKVTARTGKSDDALGFPESYAGVTAEPLKRLGTSYLNKIRSAGPAAHRIIDKMPANFRFAGLVHLALPNARIIHVRRNPVDTCLSCFSILFAGDQPFAYELGELGRYYRAYEALMEHWREVLAPGVMLEVQYEQLIADTERQARQMVAHCGLEWDDKCLAFYATQRPVKTASALQVRQPIYRTSVGRWRPDPDRLRPLLAALSGDFGRPAPR